ncbi:hypothetical protein D7X48_10405 [bacterium D16-50]|nr:hypothetical protein D7X48_10405 [bacterium D16-50]
MIPQNPRPLPLRQLYFPRYLRIRRDICSLDQHNPFCGAYLFHAFHIIKHIAKDMHREAFLFQHVPQLLAYPQCIPLYAAAGETSSAAPLVAMQ